MRASAWAELLVSWLLVSVLLVFLACAEQVPLLIQGPRKKVEKRAAQYPAAQAVGAARHSYVVLAKLDPPERAREVVLGYLRAIERESLPELAASLAPNALLSDLSETDGQRAVAVWESRFARNQQAERPLDVDANQITVFTPAQAQILRPRCELQLTPSGSDLLVLVRRQKGSRQKIPVPERVEFLVSLQAGHWVISKISETHSGRN